jgi:hypothetical protein
MVTPLALEGRIAAFACTRARHPTSAASARIDARHVDVDLAGGSRPAGALTDEVLRCCLRMRTRSSGAAIRRSVGGNRLAEERLASCAFHSRTRSRL